MVAFRDLRPIPPTAPCAAGGHDEVGAALQVKLTSTVVEGASSQAMTTSDFDLFAFLAEPGRPASVATVTASGKPALGLLWFAFEDGRFWFHTPARPGRPVPFLRAARGGQEVSAMVATFAPPDVRQVRVTGPARVEAPDLARVQRIYRRYVPGWSPEWEAQTRDPELRLWSLSPGRGMAVTFPGLENRPSFRWSSAAELLR